MGIEELKKLIDYLRVQGPGKQKSLDMIEVRLNEMSRGIKQSLPTEQEITELQAWEKIAEVTKSSESTFNPASFYWDMRTLFKNATFPVQIRSDKTLYDNGYRIVHISSLPPERKPVVVDSFIAEWYEPRKYNILSYLLELATKEKDPVFSKWYRSCEGKHNNPMANADELLAEMHIHGYTVKKEPTVHHLKIGLTYFKAVRDGRKTFEIRKNDRDYKVGDILVLQEYTCGSYTDEECEVKVTYMTDYEQKDDYVVLGIVPVEEEAE